MSLQADNLFVIFKDGWHDTEVADEGGLEWQWSQQGRDDLRFEIPSGTPCCSSSSTSR